MIANSMIVHSHPPELVTFMEELQQRGIIIINSAVFNGGFLIGQDYYNYRLMDPVRDQQLFQWRKDFFQLCEKCKLKPAQVCTVFELKAPEVTSIALNSTNVNRVKLNLDMVAAGNDIVPVEFWKEMKEQGLIDKDYSQKKKEVCRTPRKGSVDF
jgi:D-threo-aldose 1-dehydrogenase